MRRSRTLRFSAYDGHRPSRTTSAQAKMKNRRVYETLQAVGTSDCRGDSGWAARPEQRRGPSVWEACCNPAVAAEVKKKHKQVLFIWLDGGISQLESWDPKPNTEFGGRSAQSPLRCPGSIFASCCPRPRSRCTTWRSSAALHTKDNAHSAGVARIQRGDPKNRGVVYPFFGSAVAKLLGTWRQRPAAVCLDQAGERRIYLSGCRLFGTAVRGVGLWRRQAARESAAARVGVRRGRCWPATSCGPRPISVTPRNIAKAPTEANMFVYDMAHGADEAARSVRHLEVFAPRCRALWHARFRPAHADRPANAGGGRDLRESRTPMAGTRMATISTAA